MLIEQPSAGKDAQERGEKDIAAISSEGDSGGTGRPNTPGSAGKEAQAPQGVLGRNVSKQVAQQGM